VHFSKYLVGADGGKSTVRKLLDIPLEGHTWQDFNIVAANLDYDVEKEAGWGPASFVVDPRFWAVVARVNRGRVLRVASGEQLDECVPDGGDWDKEAAICRLRKRLAKILPGSENAEILNISPYRTHQRVVPNYVMGNVILAGDAAHVSWFLNFRLQCCRFPSPPCWSMKFECVTDKLSTAS
jgi:2-polyprenyl-6-methoxyphenol hydroxylase-like FAD-dependent oxidoreductase